MQALSFAFSLMAAALSFPTLMWVNRRWKLMLLLPNFLGTAWAPYVALVGLAGFGLGVASGFWVAAVLGALAAVVSTWNAVRAAAPRDAAFARALGSGWRALLTPEVTRRMRQRRWWWGLPSAPAAVWLKEIVFASVGKRALLCDVWKPPPGVPPSGLGIVYLHGSAWYLLDKDLGTRRFFGQLAAQGHVVMDVAYRMCPETDAYGMVSDAQRAVCWLKAHRHEHGVRAEKVVLMGGSAGGYVALLAAFTAGKRDFTAGDVSTQDASVAAVVSYYGVTDLVAYDRFAQRFKPVRPPPQVLASHQPSRALRWVFKALTGRDFQQRFLHALPPHARMMSDLVGAQSAATDEQLARVSPMSHVDSLSPLTLHFQAEYDHLVPVDSGRALMARLTAVGVPCVYIEIPRALHAFDLLVPPLISPAGQASLFDVERFLAYVNAQPVAALGKPWEASSEQREGAVDAHVVLPGTAAPQGFPGQRVGAEPRWARARKDSGPVPR